MKMSVEKKKKIEKSERSRNNGGAAARRWTQYVFWGVRARKHASVYAITDVVTMADAVESEVRRRMARRRYAWS